MSNQDNHAFGAAPQESKEPLDRLSSLIAGYEPVLAPKKSPWRSASEATLMSAPKGLLAVEGLLAYLDVTSPDHDGQETYRRVRYDVVGKAFICIRTGQVMKNVQGWMPLAEEI